MSDPQWRENVEVLVRIVANNEFVTPAVSIGPQYLKRRNLFFKAVCAAFRVDGLTSLFPNLPERHINPAFPALTLLQEVSTTEHQKHGKLHKRWMTVDFDTHDEVWIRYYNRNVVNRTEREETLFVEVHIGWERAGEDSAWWHALKVKFDEGGKGLAKLEEGTLKQVVVEGDGYSVKEVPNFEVECPQRAPVQPFHGCNVCRAAAGQLSTKHKAGFNRLKAVYNDGGEEAANVVKLSADGTAEAPAQANATSAGWGASLSIRPAKEEQADVEMSG